MCEVREPRSPEAPLKGREMWLDMFSSLFFYRILS